MRGLHKGGFCGQILKATELNQKWARVKRNSLHLLVIARGTRTRGIREWESLLPQMNAYGYGSLRSQGRRRIEPYCVFATRGGAAVVTNDVASSIAGPNGVGMVMRNGTRMRVPAIGTNAISILRSVARYLMTGRSGI